MLDKKITTVLFDLDGTLLPMDVDIFTKAYFQELSQKAVPLGYEPKVLMDAVWESTVTMMKNDGTEKNSERFWVKLSALLGEGVLALRPMLDQFYLEEFDRIKKVVGKNPLAKAVVRGLLEKGYQVVLATNPLFPIEAVRTRLSWVGLSPEDFSEVTDYEGYSFCKPSKGYYQEILQKIGRKGSECLMVGNDVEEDLVAQTCGMSVFLITDCLINSRQKDISAIPQGSFQDFMAFAGLE